MTSRKERDLGRNRLCWACTRLSSDQTVTWWTKETFVWLAVLFFSAQSSYRAKVSKQRSLTNKVTVSCNPSRELLECKRKTASASRKERKLLRVHLMKVHQQNGDKPCVTRQKRLRGRLIFNRLENPFGKNYYHFTCVDAWLSAIHWEKLQKIIDHSKINTISLRCDK